MPDIASLLARPGLDPAVRALLAANAAILGADWPRFAACLVAGKEHGLGRPHVEEMLLQAVLYFGFPRAIAAFDSLQECWPGEATPPQGGGLPEPEQMAAGREVFDTIYGKNSEPVRAMLGSMHGELHDFVLGVAYGRILTRPGLPPQVRELLAVTALESLDQVPQLVAHARGALAFGASEAEVREAVYTARLSEDGIDELMDRVARRTSSQ